MNHSGKIKPSHQVKLQSSQRQVANCQEKPEQSSSDQHFRRESPTRTSDTRACRASQRGVKKLPRLGVKKKLLRKFLLIKDKLIKLEQGWQHRDKLQNIVCQESSIENYAGWLISKKPSRMPLDIRLADLSCAKNLSIVLLTMKWLLHQHWNKAKMQK